MKIRELKESPIVNIRDWMKKHVKNFDDELLEIKDGEAWYDAKVILQNTTRIDVPFAKVNGGFTVAGFSCDIESLKNCPRVVMGDFHIMNQPKLRSLEHGPIHVDGYYYVTDCSIEKISHLSDTLIMKAGVDFSRNPIKSLAGIHKELDLSLAMMEGGGGTVLLEDCPIERDLLGLILIPGFQRAKFGFNRPKELIDAYEIIEKYIGKGRKGALDAQEELEDNDLGHFSGI